MRTLFAQFARFGVVGTVGLVIDIGVFNLLLFTVLSPANVHEGPLLAKVVSTTIAIGTNWLGNRYWTFREHRGRRLVREGVEFAIVSVGGMAIGLLCLWVSHYLLGFTSPLADNISSNVVGLGLGTLFRFALYRAWVFSPRRGEAADVFPVDSARDAGEGRRVADGADAATALPRPSSRPGAATAPAAAGPRSD